MDKIKIGKKKISILQIIRFSVQLLFFIILPSLYIQTLAGIRVIYESIINGTVSGELILSLVEIIAIIPITIFLGRFFCGWMCGFGSFLDFIHIIAGKFIKKKFVIGKKTDKILKSFKYILLVVLIIFAWTFGIEIFNKLSPWDVFGMTAIVGNIPDIPGAVTLLPVASVFLLVIIIGSMFVERFFCRYLCPLGGLFSIVSIFRIGKIKKPTTNCGKCRVCTNNCPMNIPLYEMEEVKTGECINCMKCVSSCPRNNAGYSIGEKDMKPIIISGMSVALITGSYYTVFSAANTFIDNNESGFIIGESSNNYADGTYTGTGSGFRGSTKIEVTVSGGKITSISTVSTNDDSKYYDRAFDSVISNILSSQSIDVDTVSGATFSSNGIIDAVKDALDNAVIETVTSTVVSSNNEESNDEAVTSDIQGSYTDGLFTGEAFGYRGTVKVSVTVENGNITNIETVSTDDDMQFYNRAYDSVVSDIINDQSADVDTVSGATYSSDGIINAVKDALENGSVSIETTEEATSQIQSDDGEYTDGTYTGSGTGFRGDVSISVEIENGKIVNIETVSSGDDIQFYDKAFETIVNEMISSQSTDVDTVSGATYSSNGIINAVKDALGQDVTETSTGKGHSKNKYH